MGETKAEQLPYLEGDFEIGMRRNFIQKEVMYATMIFMAVDLFKRNKNLEKEGKFTESKEENFMKKQSLLLLSLALVFLLTGIATAAAEFGTDLTISTMVQQTIVFDTTTGYEGNAWVNGKTANVTVTLDNTDTWPSTKPPPVQIRIGPDTGGDPFNFRGLWDQTGYSWPCIKDEQIKVTVKFSSYIVNSLGKGSISRDIQIGNHIFQKAVDGSADFLDEPNKEISQTVSFQELFVAGGLDVTGPELGGHGDQHYGGSLTIHEVKFEFIPPPQCAKCDNIEVLIDFVTNSGYNHGIKNSLLAQLGSAKKSIDNGKNNTAINQLNAFINHVSAQKGKKLPPSDADYMIACAQTIINNLS